MTSAHKIADIIHPEPMGDMLKYFDYVDNMFQANDGDNDFQILSSDAYSQSVPIAQDQFTRFKITDGSMDIVDLSKGFIHLNIEFNWKMFFKDIDTDLTGVRAAASTGVLPLIRFFLGFKSAAHIINVYNVYSNGRLTSCKNTKVKYEQALVYSCKAKEERVGRPGMYSPHKEVLKMTNCVCGTYVYLDPNHADWSSDHPNTKMEMVIQVDDLLPFSAMTYYPRFLFGDLELELSCNLINNMVFCPIPMENVLDAQPMAKNATIMSDFLGDPAGLIQPVIKADDIALKDIINSKAIVDSRFHQCGDWAKCLLPLNKAASDEAGKNTVTSAYVRFTADSLNITNAKSYIHGFRLKSEARANIAAMYKDKKMKIPAQWIDQYSFSQQPTESHITTNIQIPMFNASQVAFTFPNSANQITVSRNPHLEGFKATIGQRNIPDKNMSTLDKAHSEMILNTLGLDSLFSAPKELLEALSRNRGKNSDWTIKKNDDSDYMLIMPLERFGSGCFCDGLSGINIPVTFYGSYMNGTDNPHYFELDVTNSRYAAGRTAANFKDDTHGLNFKLRKNNINLFVISDAFWVFGENGGEFIKDVQTEDLRDIE